VDIELDPLPIDESERASSPPHRGLRRTRLSLPAPGRGTAPLVALTLSAPGVNRTCARGLGNGMSPQTTSFMRTRPASRAPYLARSAATRPGVSVTSKRGVRSRRSDTSGRVSRVAALRRSDPIPCARARPVVVRRLPLGRVRDLCGTQRGRKGRVCVPGLWRAVHSRGARPSDRPTRPLVPRARARCTLVGRQLALCGDEHGEVEARRPGGGRSCGLQMGERSPSTPRVASGSFVQTERVASNSPRPQVATRTSARSGCPAAAQSVSGASLRLRFLEARVR
jgi:hypothetical protein